MDENMEAVEIVFAQRLASGEPITRKRALKHLREHIKEESAKEGGFAPESLTRLCKGLHYTMWMQDKMVLQEELADDICGLLKFFCGENQILHFAKAMITSLSKEWPSIDRWRMDKFLMLTRRLIRTLFLRLADKDWDPQLSEQYLQMFRETLICVHSPFCESLKYHCASIWLDELDNAATLSAKILNKERSLDFVRPYIQLLQERISYTFFRSICSEIFDVILYDCEDRLNLQEEMEENTEEEGRKGEEGKANGEDNGKVAHLEFDYRRISELLFEVGKQQHVSGKRRKRIYALSKKFECVVKDLDPFPMAQMEHGKPERKRRKKRGETSDGG